MRAVSSSVRRLRLRPSGTGFYAGQPKQELGVKMNSLLILLSCFFAQLSYGENAPPLPVEDWVRRAEVENVVVGRLTKVSTRTFSTTDWTIQPPRTRYYDSGTLAVERSLKGRDIARISIEILFRSNEKVTGPPLHKAGREGVVATEEGSSFTGSIDPAGSLGSSLPASDSKGAIAGVEMTPNHACSTARRADTPSVSGTLWRQLVY